MFEESVVILRKVLRDSGGHVTFRERRTRTTGDLGQRHVSPSDVKIEVIEPDPRAVAEATRDKSIVALAPAMPLALIAPVERAVALLSRDELDPYQDARANRCTWGVRAIKADVSPLSGVSATVAVLDTGIDGQHPAFRDRGVELVEKDFTGTGQADRHGHGTHCAGTIFGRDVDGIRIGVAPGVKRALIAKVIGGGSSTSALLSAFQWAVDNEANVISMSLGYDFTAFCEFLKEKGMPPRAAVSRALQAYRDNIRLFDSVMRMNEASAALSKGAVVIAAAGNESERDNPKVPFVIARSSPAAADGVISVASVFGWRDRYKVAAFSNSGATISAPGVGVLSAQANGSLVAMDGTSMACPHVAGLAALYWDNSPKAQPSVIAARLIASARFSGLFPFDTEADVGVGLATAPQSA